MSVLTVVIKYTSWLKDHCFIIKNYLDEF